MKLHLKRNIVFFFITAILIIISLNYIIFLKVESIFFKKLDFKSGNFTDSYTPIKVSNQDITFDLYNIENPSSKITILYIPSNAGILNNVLNSVSAKYNLFAINYPKEKKFQTFENLVKISELAVKEMVATGIASENIIIFGQGIGGNIALKMSKKTPFKSILILNALNGEKKYCNTYFYTLACLFVGNTISMKGYNLNLIYYFFNQNSITPEEENYEIFNQIDSREKFFFQISGTETNFNFNQILDFYNNETLTQNHNFNFHETDEVQNSEDIIENDGLLGDSDSYID